MKLIGLTGGIGTGKSTVSQMLRAQGLEVIDADLLAREVVEANSFGLRALVQVFGSEILKYGPGSFELDRPVLASKIFSDEGCKLLVERIVHPLIQWRAHQEFSRIRQSGKQVAFYDAALIFEKGLHDQFDHVVVVSAPSEVQIERLMKRDKLSRDVALKRIASQWPLDKKTARAHFVIDNGNSLHETKKYVLDFLQAVLKAQPNNQP